MKASYPVHVGLIQVRADGPQNSHWRGGASLGVASRAERLIYRIAGLPVALSGLLLGSSGGDGADPLQTAFVWQYWHPIGAGEWSELLGGMVAWPIACANRI